ncbi:MAG: polymer-forming cytoskeletal protein, partial [Planctomycetota bacterium]
VDAGGVQVDGRVEGNLNANDTVRLNANGAVKGDITAAKMVMAEGAAFYGMCAVGPDAKQQPAKSGGQPPQGGGQPGNKK